MITIVPIEVGQKHPKVTDFGYLEE